MIIRQGKCWSSELKIMDATCESMMLSATSEDVKESQPNKLEFASYLKRHAYSCFVFSWKFRIFGIDLPGSFRQMVWRKIKQSTVLHIPPFSSNNRRRVCLTPIYHIQVLKHLSINMTLKLHFKLNFRQYCPGSLMLLFSI
jgi:hypothetical protein